MKMIKDECTDILRLRITGLEGKDKKLDPDEAKRNLSKNALARRTKPPPWLNYNEFKKIRPFNSNRIFNFTLKMRDGRRLKSDKQYI